MKRNYSLCGHNNQEEYVAQMVELCDEEAKAFSTLTADLKKLVH